ncbi:ATP-binding cassette domain-containing protein [Microbacterium sp. HD4P20]|uniref:ABC transporter ATP-binding protein n=1 Tax=Microbacterium sp. HD4P20 TaxID=2864874 RepID=UPI001C640E55|nr:ABC transporter ATP-binding protein [Microbacterium sp. HD4P20]MCP2635683.1 ATP-binding cassette domain-containing protein [Microbacterium sp. HD4P20]
MLLEAKNVSKVFRARRGGGETVAVKDATLRAEPGRFIAIVGESGSGKSTLGRLLLNLLAPTSGAVELDGAPVAGMDRREAFAYRRQVQAVLQDPAGSLNPRKRVDEAVGEVIRLHGIARGRAAVRDRVAEVLEQVGMTPPGRFFDRYPHELSGGQRQRVLIARAIALNPRIIVADEAVSALDASVKAGVLKVMRDLQDRLGVGYVFITHDLPVVRKVADEVYVMKSGEIVEHNTKAAIFAAPQHPYTRELLAAAPVLT